MLSSDKVENILLYLKDYVEKLRQLARLSRQHKGHP
jgi:hypothetical protein